MTATGGCGGIKGQYCVPFPGLGPHQPQPIPVNQWVTVVDFTGITAQTFVHKVTVEPCDAVVKWRRRGLLGLCSKEGSFQGQIDFNVYQGEVRVTIELWVDDPNVSITVTGMGELPPIPPIPPSTP